MGNKLKELYYTKWINFSYFQLFYLEYERQLWEIKKFESEIDEIFDV